MKCYFAKTFKHISRTLIVKHMTHHFLCGGSIIMWQAIFRAQCEPPDTLIAICSLENWQVYAFPVIAIWFFAGLLHFDRVDVCGRHWYACHFEWLSNSWPHIIHIHINLKWKYAVCIFNALKSSIIFAHNFFRHSIEHFVESLHKTWEVSHTTHALERVYEVFLLNLLCHFTTAALEDMFYWRRTRFTHDFDVFWRKHANKSVKIACKER